MKKFKYILLLILLFPFNIYAYELTCPAPPLEYGNTFDCYIKGDNTINYDELSGDIELAEQSIFSCEVVDMGNGLAIKESSTDFSYTGISSTEELVKITCKIVGKPSASGTEQIIIPNFKYHALDDNKDVFTEVLRSNSIQYVGYVPEVKEEQKPRNTNNPDTRLKNVIEPNLDFIFSSFKTEYNISVKYEVEKVELNAIPNNENSTIEIIGSQELSIGENVIDIYVTSPDGTTKTCYTFTINRLKRGEDIYYEEKDSSLSSLSIEGYNINFESIIHEYKIHLKYNVNEVTIKAEAVNPKATIEISNANDLKNGSVIKVTVTSADSSNSTVYSIKVTKDAPPKDYKNLIYISVFVLAIAIVIVIIIRTNIKNKGNPLLKKKKEAKEEIKVNDKKLDLNNVPETTGTNTIQPVPQVVEKVETLITNAIEPTTEPVETADIPAPPIAPVTDPSIPAPPVLSTDINQAQQNNTNNQ